MSALLEIKGLTTCFYTQAGVVRAVNGISYRLAAGETVGIVGESGCGKSVSALSVLRLIPDPPGRVEAGQVLFKDQDLLQLTEDQMGRIRGREIAMIFQDPMTSLNPVLTIGYQIMEALGAHLGLGRRAARDRVVELLTLVGIPKAGDRLYDYPHQFSGGMRQRVMIAMALACSPALLIADEPTTALDVTVQAQILTLVKRLQAQLGMAVLWITHDLGVVARLARRVIVMYAGYVIEDAPVRELFGNPKHPYTLGLLGSLPGANPARHSRLFAIPGQPPDLASLPAGCPFAARCHYRTERCLTENPSLQPGHGAHLVACWEAGKTGMAANHG